MAGRGSCEHARQFSQRIQLPPAIQSAAALPTKEDELGNTPLDYAECSLHPAVAPFVTEVNTAFRAGDYPGRIRLCGSTPEWTIRAEGAKLENDGRENGASQPTEEKKKEAEVEAAQDINLQEIRAAPQAAQPCVPEDERKPAAIADGE